MVELDDLDFKPDLGVDALYPVCDKSSILSHSASQRTSSDRNSPLEAFLPEARKEDRRSGPEKGLCG